MRRTTVGRCGYNRYMTGFTPGNGKLAAAETHQTRRRDTYTEVRTHLRHLDVVEQLRWLAVTATEYRDQRAALVHAIIVTGGDLADIMWLTMDGKQHIANEWLDWVDLQITIDEHWSTAVYRKVAVELGVVDRFEYLLSVRGINSEDS